MRYFMTALDPIGGAFLTRQRVRLARGVMAALAASFLSTPAFAQDGSSGDLWRDATTPGATRTYEQNCVRVLGSSVCRSPEGTSFSVGTEFGPQFTASRDNASHWSWGAGAEFAPSIMGQGVAISGVRYAGSGNTEVCAGPTFGLEPIVSVSPQMCYSVDRDRAREMRDAIASAQQAQRNAPAVTAPDRALDQARQDVYQAYQQMLSQVRNDPNVYNNPFAANGGSPRVSAPYTQPVPMPPTPNPPANSTGNGAGMSMDQFRASVNQSMEQFRQADAQFRQSQATQPSYQAPATPRPDRQLVFDENAPRGANVTQSPAVYAPRNGYDAQGYRQDSPRNQYDAQGYRVDSPRSQYDAQGYRTDSARPRYDAQGYRVDSTQQAPAPVQVSRYSYDTTGQRNASSGPVSQASQAPVIPNVTQRAPGTQSQTAVLQFPGE